MTTNTKTIAVLGALGGQGRSVVNTFLADGSFHVRGVTRSVDSSASKDLEAQGVKMMTGDVKDPSSLVHAFTGADIAFVVVNFWDPDIGTKEGDLTKAIFEQAKKAGIKHVIYSSLANVKNISGGKITVPHFTLKAEAWEHLQTMGFDSVTAVEPAAYYSNWFSFFKAVEDESGTLVWTWPGKKNHAFSQFDVNTGVGPSVLAAAKDPSKYNLQDILLEGEKISIEDVVAGLSKKLGKPGKVHYEDPAKFSTFFEGAHEIAEMVRWFDEYGYFGPETETRKHSSGHDIGGLLTFKEWLDTGAIEKLRS